MSEGIRSGVNWIRLKLTSRIRAIELTISVLARPGTPTSRHVAAGEDGREDLLDHLALADDDLVQLGDHDVARVTEFVEKLRDPVAGRGHAIVRPMLNKRKVGNPEAIDDDRPTRRGRCRT